MTVKEIEEILSSTSSSDWVIEEELGAYTYKQDVLLRIQKHPIDYHTDKFSGEEWATTMHADSEAYRVVYDVFYGESFIETKQFVAVDGCRAFLPMPTFGTKVIPYRDYLFAKIVAPDTLDEYINRSGLTVSKEDE